MCKSCVLAAYNLVRYGGISFALFPTISLKFNVGGISALLIRAYELSYHLLVHIKFSLNQSVFSKLSTVSTHPTIETTKLKFNKIIIIKEVRKTS